MANIIETVTKYLPILDEQYRVQARSSVLDAPAEFVRQTKEAKKVKIAKMSTDKLANYGRGSGFVKGDVTLDWEEHTFTQDRGRALQIDALDNIETLGLAFGRLSGTFQRDATIPELDAYRFSSYFAKAGIVEEVALTEDNVLSVIDELISDQDDAEVPEGSKFLFVSPKTYKLMMNDKNIVKNFNVNENWTKALNKKIYEYNDLPIIKVPAKRFYQELTFLDGTTSGQEVGGYTGTGAIDLMIVSTTAVVQISKRVIARIWAPTREEAVANGADGVNPDADAWKFDFRVYHDAWTLENKTKGIAAVVAPETEPEPEPEPAKPKVTVVAGPGGVVDPLGIKEVDYEGDLDITITPGSGKVVDTAMVGDVDMADSIALGVLKLEDIKADMLVFITFKEDETEPEPEPAKPKVTIVAGNGGVVDPLGIEEVTLGGNLNITITPDADKVVASALVGGVEKKGDIALGVLALTNILVDTLVHITFEA